MLPSKARTGLAILLVAAASSLTIGVVNALRPRQSQDVKTVREWSELWLANSNPYTTAHADYAPNALVTLAPLALVPESWIALPWAVLNLGLAGVAVWLTMRVLFPGAPLFAGIVPALLFLCWGGLRVGLGVGQFQLLALTLGLAAVASSNRRPDVAGILLGVAMLKPHVAGAFFLWAVLTGRLRVAAIALVVVIAGVLAFSARLGQNPVDIISTYLSVLDSELGGRQAVAGIDVRPVAHLVLGRTLEAELAYVTLIAVFFSLLVAVTIRGSRSHAQARDAVALSACCAFGVLAFPHSPYDIVLLLPAAMWLYRSWITPGGGWLADKHPAGQRIMFGLVQVALVLEIPGLAYRLDKHNELAVTPLLSTIDAAVVALVFGWVVWTAFVTGAPGRGSRSSIGLSRSGGLREST